MGLDLGLLENRLTLSADYYVSETEDALAPVPLPTYLGNFGGAVYQNAGNIENQRLGAGPGLPRKPQGLHLRRRLYPDHHQERGNQSAGAKASIRGGIGLTRTSVGQPVGRLYLIPFCGIFQSQDEIEQLQERRRQGHSALRLGRRRALQGRERRRHD